jgi:hypothetical protein
MQSAHPLHLREGGSEIDRPPGGVIRNHGTMRDDRYLSPAMVCELIPGMTLDILAVRRHQRLMPPYLQAERQHRRLPRIRDPRVGRQLSCGDAMWVDAAVRLWVLQRHSTKSLRADCEHIRAGLVGEPVDPRFVGDEPLKHGGTRHA